MKSDTALCEGHMYWKRYINICYKTYYFIKFLSPELFKLALRLKVAPVKMLLAERNNGVILINCQPNMLLYYDNTDPSPLSQAKHAAFPFA